jgi:hypothetical protein
LFEQVCGELRDLVSRSGDVVDGFFAPLILLKAVHRSVNFTSSFDLDPIPATVALKALINSSGMVADDDMLVDGWNVSEGIRWES